jgi:hypothetical protein
MLDTLDCRSVESAVRIVCRSVFFTHGGSCVNDILTTSNGIEDRFFVHQVEMDPLNLVDHVCTEVVNQRLQFCLVTHAAS